MGQVLEDGRVWANVFPVGKPMRARGSLFNQIEADLARARALPGIGFMQLTQNLPARSDAPL